MTAVADTTVANPAPARAAAANTAIDRVGMPGWLQATPFALVFLVFFIIPLILVVIVSFWDYNDYAMLPSFTLRSYTETFEGCWTQLPDLCTILKTYLSTAKFCFIVWVTTLVIGFTVAYFLAFHVRSATTQMVLFLVCTIPFWTSNVIRMISWIPLLGRNGLVNDALIRAHRRRQAGRMAALFAVLGVARVHPPLHLLHGGADLQFDDAHRQAPHRSGL